MTPGALRISTLELVRPLRPETSRPRNLILSLMPEEPYRQLARSLVPVEMPQGMQLSTPNELVEHIYFPVSGLISVDALTDKGESVEVGVIGREGFAGLVCAAEPCADGPLGGDAGSGFGLSHPLGACA